MQVLSTTCFIYTYILAYIIEISSNNVDVAGKAFEIIVRLFSTQVTRTEDVLYFPGHLGGKWGHTVCGGVSGYWCSTRSFLNWGGSAFALWGICISPMTSTSWER